MVHTPAPVCTNAPLSPAEAVEAALDAWSSAELARIAAQAEGLRARYELGLRRGGGGDPKAQRLVVRVRHQTAARSLPGAVGLEWAEVRYVTGADGRRLYRTRYLPRGTGDKYPAGTFRGRVPDWQLPLVREIEDEMALLRRRIRVITELRAAFRSACRTLHPTPGGTDVR